MEDTYSRRFMVEPSKGNISELQFERFPSPSTLNYWKTNFKTEVCSSSGHPKEEISCITQDEMANSVGDLETSQSISGRVYHNFETFDARIATALMKIIQNANFKKKPHWEKHRAQKKDRFLRDRQIGKKIYEYFRVTGTHESILDFSDLMSVTLRGDDVQGFGSRWDEVLLSTVDVPSDKKSGKLGQNADT